MQPVCNCSSASSPPRPAAAAATPKPDASLFDFLMAINLNMEPPMQPGAKKEEKPDGGQPEFDIKPEDFASLETQAGLNALISAAGNPPFKLELPAALEPGKAPESTVQMEHFLDPNMTLLPDEAAAPTPAKAWDIQELSWQIRTALNQAADVEAQVPEPEILQSAFVQANPKTGQGDKLENKKLFSLPPMESASLDAMPAEMNPSSEAEAKPFFASDAEPLPELKIESTKPNEKQFSLDLGETNSDLPTQTAKIELTPQVVIETPEGPRMPTFVEQMREVAEMLADRAQGTIRAGQNGVEANLKLYPPDLGGVRVTLNMQSDNSIQASFHADRAETAALIQRNLPQLQEAFARQGLVVERIQVNTSVAGSSSSSADHSQTNQQHDPRRNDFLSQQQRREQQARDRQAKQYDEQNK